MQLLAKSPAASGKTEALDLALPPTFRAVTLLLEVARLQKEAGHAALAATTKSQIGKLVLMTLTDDPQMQEVHLRMTQEILAEALQELPEEPLYAFQRADILSTASEVLLKSAALRRPLEQESLLRQAETAILQALNIFRDDSVQQFIKTISPQNMALINLLMADAQNKLGNIYFALPATSPEERQNNISRAQECFLNALSCGDPAHHPEILAMTHFNLGALFNWRARHLGGEAEPAFAQAQEHYAAALAVLDKTRQTRLYALAHTSLGELLLSWPAPDETRRKIMLQQAVLHLGQALEATDKQISPLQYARVVYHQGLAQAAFGNFAEAQQLLREALTYRKYLPDGGAEIERWIAGLEQNNLPSLNEIQDDRPN